MNNLEKCFSKGTQNLNRIEAIVLHNFILLMRKKLQWVFCSGTDYLILYIVFPSGTEDIKNFLKQTDCMA